MKTAKGLHPVKRFVLPALAVISSVAIIFCAVYAHGYVPYLAAKENGEFSFPVLFYLIVFIVVMAAGIFLARRFTVGGMPRFPLNSAKGARRRRKVTTAQTSTARNV